MTRGQGPGNGREGEPAPARTTAWCKASFLPTGDLSAEGETYLLVPDSTVLKVAHHGAWAGTSLRSLEVVRSRVAVIPWEMQEYCASLNAK